MCGIAGIVCFRDSKIGKEALLKMAAVLKHRGPDDEGMHIEEENGLFLFHNRLSIIDLSQKAHQPMKRGRYITALNGEIYNFREIRQELGALNYRFFSDSDTEVVCAAYEEWGDGCLDKLRGMFAFSIWDSKKRSIFLARDRLGIKPLYYYDDGTMLIFSSEVKAIKASGVIGVEPDYGSIERFLSLGYILPPKTMYRNVSDLEPGHYIERSREATRKSRYYALGDAFVGSPMKASETEVVAKTRAELIESVKYHLVSDVEVGAFLSGGVDSSSIVSLMRECGCEQIKTVTVALPGSELNESEYAEHVAETFKTDHIKIDIKEKDLLAHLDNIFNAMDQPTIDGINTYFVSLAAKKAGLKVVLSGLGGDELFGGYPSFRDVPDIFDAVQKLRCFESDVFKKGTGLLENFKSVLMNKDASLEDVYFAYRGIFAKAQIKNILKHTLEKNGMPEIDIASLCGISTDRIRSDFEKIAFLESAFYMSGQLLRDTDVFSMAHSIEIRVPFVDHKLVEFMNQVPIKYKRTKGSKNLLISAIGDLPERIYRRQKAGFTLPFDSWLRGGLRPVVMDTLFNSRIFNQTYMHTLFDKFDNHELQWSQIWSLFVLARLYGE